MSPTLVVTRPEPQASDWVQRLRQAGFEAGALPLLRIAAVGDSGPLAAAWADLATFALVVFVSPNAVAHFFTHRGTAQWPAGTRAAAPGPGSAEALRAAGVAPALVVQPAEAAPQADSEALWQQLQGDTWVDRRVLVVRGAGGRDWLADTLRAAGAAVRFVQAYERTAPVLDGAQQALLAEALARPREHVWLFSSAEAIGHLQALAPEADWSPARALASHPRIARRARALGIAEVHEVAPVFEAWLAAARALDAPAAER